jgi:hypothetical protein
MVWMSYDQLNLPAMWVVAQLVTLEEVLRPTLRSGMKGDYIPITVDAGLSVGATSRKPYLCCVGGYDFVYEAQDRL